MKDNFFKYLFILVIIILIVFTIYFLKKDNENTNQKMVEPIIEQEEETSNDLTIGVSNFDTINPIMTRNKEIQKITRLIFQPLVEIEENYKLKMCLAQEISKSGDNTYLIKLDTNAKWQDGTTVCARDVQFTIDRLKERDSIYSHNVRNIIKVEIIDSSMLKIFLDADVPFFEYNLTFPILSNYYYLNEDFFSSSKIPIGTGIYKISEIQSSYIQLQKSEYCKDDVKIKNIRVNIFSQMGEVYNSFKIQNIDLINTSNVNVEQYIGTIGFNKYDYKGREFDYLSFNCQNEALRNKELRQAINYAIDKSNIISEGFENKYYISQFPLDYGNYLYEGIESKSVFNAEKVKELLENAGWNLDKNVWMKKINERWVKANLKLTVCKDDTYRIKVADIIKKQLEKVGIKINVVPVTQENYNSALINKNYDIILTGVYSSYSPNLQNFFAEGNISNYSSEKMSKLLGEVQNISNEDMLKEKYKKIVEIYEEDVPFVSLYRNKNSVVYTTSLVGEISANNYNCFYNIDKWIKK